MPKLSSGRQTLMSVCAIATVLGALHFARHEVIGPATFAFNLICVVGGSIGFFALYLTRSK